jgi:membrane fusion protein (multidrug efflux system)
VSGQVKKVLVERNQVVKAGEPLAELDSRDFAVALEQKQAAVNSARATVELLKAQLNLSRAQVVSAEATARQTTAAAAAEQAIADRANADLKRAEELYGNHTISPQEYDSAKASATAAAANARASEGKAASDQAKVGEAQAQVAASQKTLERGQAQVKQAEMDVEEANLNLSYTLIIAPEDGQVTKKAVEAGNYVQVGQNLMALVPARVFVTANFKETQLDKIRTNQPVKIMIDSVDSGPFSGYVESIQAGSGAAFSLLPPENAVGNFVKVVQRIPVRICFDNPVQASHVLGPGMSAVPSVHVMDFEVSETVLALVAAGLALGIGVLWWMLAGRKERGA